MACYRILDPKVKHFESRNDRQEIEVWIESGRQGRELFLADYPYGRRPEKISELTPNKVYDMLSRLLKQLRPLGGIGEGLEKYFNGAAGPGINSFKDLLRTAVDDSFNLAEKVDAAGHKITGFGGDSQIIKKILATYDCEETIPIFSTNHLQYFVKNLGVDAADLCKTRYGTPYDNSTTGQKWQLLSEALLAKKAHHDSLAKRDNVYLMYVLYFSPPTPLKGLLKPWTPPPWWNPPTTSTLEQLIAAGESATLEFKSSLRWNSKSDRADKVDKGLERAVAKTVAAFMNSKGGTLLIGVDNQGKVIGIDDDLTTVKWNNQDGLELQLRNVLDSLLGPEFSHCVDVSFAKADGLTVCVVRAECSSKPVWLDGKEFYVRSGNTSPPLPPPAVPDYIQQHKCVG